VTLKVGKEKRDAVQRYLEMQVGKRYKNVTMVNDCSTMTLRALGMENMFYDQSPNGVAMILAAKKTGGDKSIGKIFQVSVKEPEHATRQLVRNTYISFQDALFNLYALDSRPRRLWIDQTHTPQDLQYYDPEVQEYVDSFQEEFLVRVDEEPELALLKARIANLNTLEESNPEKSRQRERRRADLVRYFDREIAKAKDEAATPSLRLKDVLFAQFKLKVLPEYRRQLEAALR
jgi:hypothetical protein